MIATSDTKSFCRDTNGAYINGSESLEEVEEIDRPFEAPIIAARYLTAANSDKKASPCSLSA